MKAVRDAILDKVYGYHMRAQNERFPAASSGADARSAASPLRSLQERGAARREAFPYVGGQGRGDVLIIIV
jgi:hypothetical protein